MNKFREWLREAKRYLFLPAVKVNNKNAIWNKQKMKLNFYLK